MSALRVIRKKTGNFLEDSEPGQLLRHKGGKTVTEGRVDVAPGQALGAIRWLLPWGHFLDLGLPAYPGM